MSIPSPLLLARLPDRASLSELLQFQLTGLIVVFTALCSIWILLEIVGSFFKRQAANAPAAAPVTAPTLAVPADADLPATTVAAIAAAVYITLDGKPHRITSIKPAAPSGGWASEGRREHFSSHRVR
jgi:Na+-transporting methylmalonyl-CoA/oxaloacetate decarboxylase gamma subunit